MGKGEKIDFVEELIRKLSVNRSDGEKPPSGHVATPSCR
jgi:hypothetical protein